ncbi:MAG: hypothetical protein H6767_02260 [Candidatus Peribacteria bacterium]|nr:MAG: hypothetical protein H6767_02260 [Candidatus Peribacteria bacterium]
MKPTTSKQFFSQQQKEANKKAFESFDFYKKTIEIMDRANIAMGRKTSYSSVQSSTLNYKTNIYGISSTQKI